MVTSINPFQREFVNEPAPEKLCNTDRLVEAMTARDIDGVVVTTQTNGYYVSSLSTPHSAPEGMGHFNVVLSRHDPDNPAMAMPDIHVSRLQYQPTWIQDIRTYASILLPLYAEVEPDEISRFIPRRFRDTPQAESIIDRYAPFSIDAVVQMLEDKSLTKATVAFDSLNYAQAVLARLPEINAVSGEGLLRYARAFKTPIEQEILRTSQWINQTALERTVAQWTPGMTWHDLGHTYHIHALTLGGFVHPPGGMAMANPDGDDPAWHGNSSLDDFELRPGTNIMFDAHGVYKGYAWDGGKTWVVGGEADPHTERVWAATAAVVDEIQSNLMPGQRVSEAVDLGLRVYEKHGIPTDDILIFFHGLGLDHLDQELMAGHRSDWRFLEDMCVSTHIQVPGPDDKRVFTEDIAFVKSSGPERLFTWDREIMRG